VWQAVCASHSLIPETTIGYRFAVSILGDVKSTLAGYTTVIIQHLAIGNITMLFRKLKRSKTLLTSMRLSLIFTTKKTVMPALR